MVRCTHASLCFFALTSSLLVQSSDAARPSQGEMQRQPPASPAGSSPTAELAVDPESIAAGAARDVEAAATAAVAVGDRGGYGGPRPPTSVAQVLRYSARRLLLGEDAATDGAAGASCHSNNVHITCSPPSPH
ncbi:hypothetical protein E2562_001469 [Oryza meyeriana var. granulata]|uniref:Uncharacterized protein n=1 Tax=Oryza meyeriana var. granulata TaxID=110450 RepID=A0A6G1DEY4_9ORYZ|nr:hypothetical protein E2562_001469 [Oryza meyeriana var. granulata]